MSIFGSVIISGHFSAPFLVCWYWVLNPEQAGFLALTFTFLCLSTYRYCPLNFFFLGPWRGNSLITLTLHRPFSSPLFCYVCYCCCCFAQRRGENKTVTWELLLLWFSLAPSSLNTSKLIGHTRLVFRSSVLTASVAKSPTSGSGETSTEGRRSLL